MNDLNPTHRLQDLLNETRLARNCLNRAKENVKSAQQRAEVARRDLQTTLYCLEHLHRFRVTLRRHEEFHDRKDHIHAYAGTVPFCWKAGASSVASD